MVSFAHAIKSFNRGLILKNRLPQGVSALNPFRDNEQVFQWSDAFYDMFYSDVHQRRLLLGINPGRLGAGQTGIPFTDTKRLFEYFGLGSPANLTHEASSAFIYQMIDAYGGASTFYSQYLVSSVCPLGFVIHRSGKSVNYNYYDSPALYKAVTPFIVEMMEKQLQWPIDRSVVYCLGTGKNLKYLSDLNNRYRWFGHIEPLEHPRYIMQYKSSQVESYIVKYLEALRAF
jgi:hypothetical protein